MPMRMFLILGVVTPRVRRLGFHHNGYTAPARCATSAGECSTGACVMRPHSAHDPS
jgi:hypothetical protein